MVAECPDQIGPYQILELIGKGGMGEVFKAKDPSYGRIVALKRILPSLQDKKAMISRFLKEARLASRFSHPSIIPIYMIEKEPGSIYYTMPYVEGETLREILRKTRDEEENHPVGSSIPALCRIFLQVCEGVSYAHSMGVVHRDIKPENIMVGKYGEVFILDWGIADLISQPTTTSTPGKVAGTLSYMAPERLQGKSMTIQADLYALGVILYQILTLHLPFHRKTVAHFRKKVKEESLVDPIEMSPNRDIPLPLSRVCKTCLAHAEEDRFQSVAELIKEVKKYTEGRPEWGLAAELDIEEKDDWQFQENLILSKLGALSNSLDFAEWVFCRISGRSFTDPLQIAIDLAIKPESEGVGILLNHPGPQSPTLDKGYCLWIAPSVVRLFRNNIQVREIRSIQFSSGHAKIETSGEDVRLFLNGNLIFSYASYLPLTGGHIGILHKDPHFQIERISVYSSSQNIWINCLALPDSFFSHGLYDLALQEYRRIGQSFPGRIEGREAHFRAGLALLEQGKQEKKEELFHLALKEFEKLYRTPGAPLEYLGKSLAYGALGEADEEAKCLELALRKFARHPLKPILKEQIIYRMHESSLNHRESAYRIILLAIRNIPDLMAEPGTRNLITTLQKNWEPLSFLEPMQGQEEIQLAIALAFWLSKGTVLLEMAKEMLQQKDVSEILLGNILFSLLELEKSEPVKTLLKQAPLSNARKEAIEAVLYPKEARRWIESLPMQLETIHVRSLFTLIRHALASGNEETAIGLCHSVKKRKLGKEERMAFDAYEIWAFLLKKRVAEASKVIRKYPLQMIAHEKSPLHFPYGTWLYLNEGPEIAAIHFSNLLDTPYPHTTALPSYILSKRLDSKEWAKQAFYWEKKQLDRQLDLFQRCIGEEEELP